MVMTSATDSQGMLQATATLPERVAAAWKAPIVAVPDELPQPRVAVGALAVPPLIVLEDIGLFPGARQWVKEAIRSLVARRDEIMGGGAFVPELARSIGRTIPLI